MLLFIKIILKVLKYWIIISILFQNANFDNENDGKNLLIDGLDSKLLVILTNR